MPNKIHITMTSTGKMPILQKGIELLNFIFSKKSLCLLLLELAGCFLRVKSREKLTAIFRMPYLCIATRK